jgi:hypothetical protein
MVVQRAALIAWITGTVFMLATIMMGVVMVHVIDATAFSEIGSNILLVLHDMLNMYADQRHNAHSLGQ